MDLSGDWTGVFDYGLGGLDAVPFTATLTDVGGVVWGETLEPNTFAKNAGPELSADVSGSRSGLELHFRKAYHGKPRGGRIRFITQDMFRQGANASRGIGASICRACRLAALL